MASLIIVTVVLPLITMILLAIRTRVPAVGWLTSFVLALGVTGFSLLTAPWGFLGLSVRYVLAALFVLAVLVSLRKPKGDEPQSEAFFRSMFKMLIGLFFGAVAMSAVGANDAPEGTIDMAFPLRGGKFMVMHGGSTSAANYHVSHPSQRFALDIVRVDGFGRRARGMMPTELDRFHIWGSDVISPCDGTVLVAVDGLPDNVPPARDEKNLAGNHVAIACQNVTVYLAHLQRGSVIVKANAPVSKGSIIGKAGNSGNTTEPHLHIHAERSGRTVNTAPGVPLTFDGEWLVRNEVVR